MLAYTTELQSFSPPADLEKQETSSAGNSNYFVMGWARGFEPPTTGATVQCSDH